MVKFFVLYGESPLRRILPNPRYSRMDLFVSMGNGTFAQQTTPFPNLTSIGHALWTIIVGWLGGVVALWLQRKDTREHQSPD